MYIPAGCRCIGGSKLAHTVRRNITAVTIVYMNTFVEYNYRRWNIQYMTIILQTHSIIIGVRTTAKDTIKAYPYIFVCVN